MALDAIHATLPGAKAYVAELKTKADADAGGEDPGIAFVKEMVQESAGTSAGGCLWLCDAGTVCLDMSTHLYTLTRSLPALRLHQQRILTQMVCPGALCPSIMFVYWPHVCAETGGAVGGMGEEVAEALSKIAPILLSRYGPEPAACCVLLICQDPTLFPAGSELLQCTVINA